MGGRAPAPPRPSWRPAGGSAPAAAARRRGPPGPPRTPPADPFGPAPRPPGPGRPGRPLHGGAAPLSIDWAYQVDPLSSVMLLVVTFVGFLIHVYSIGYMSHDPGYARFMSYLNLFMFAMLTLVLGANYAVLFVGWEGVGLCSYLLIGFWFDRRARPTRARRPSSSTGSATRASCSACS